MDSPNDVLFLRAQNRRLEEELADVGKSVTHFVKNLVDTDGRRQNPSLSEEYGLQVRDLERQLERIEELATLNEGMLGSVSETSAIHASTRSDNTHKILHHETDKYIHGRQNIDMTDQISFKMT
ncbi:hypothetical protein C0989_007950 [Termitomyces sp. Mn162]|nr:hypothetical protein C0989_007950 [Termitomyces sp. Mn162]